MKNGREKERGIDESVFRKSSLHEGNGDWEREVAQRQDSRVCSPTLGSLSHTKKESSKIWSASKSKWMEHGVHWYEQY